MINLHAPGSGGRQSKRNRMQIMRLIDAEWKRGFCAAKKWVETTSFSCCRKSFFLPEQLYDFTIIMQSIVIKGQK